MDWRSEDWQSNPRSSWALEVKGMNYAVTICQRFDRLLSHLWPIRTSGSIARWYLVLVLELFQCYCLGSNQWGHAQQRNSIQSRHRSMIGNRFGIRVLWFDWAHDELTQLWVDQNLLDSIKNYSWSIMDALVWNRGRAHSIWGSIGCWIIDLWLNQLLNRLMN